MCNCENYRNLQTELKIKDKLIEILTDSLNDPRYCEDHIIIFRKCLKKNLQCGDCIVKEFYDNLDKSVYS